MCVRISVRISEGVFLILGNIHIDVGKKYKIMGIPSVCLENLIAKCCIS